MVGVAAFSYATLHLTLYIADQAFDWRLVASEIVFRFYLTVGFLALMSLFGTGGHFDGRHDPAPGRAALAASCTNLSMSSPSWPWCTISSSPSSTSPNPLSSPAYSSWLMANRAIVWIGGEDRRPSFWSLISLSVIAGLLTATGEATYYRLANGFDPWRVLAANVSWYFDRRPGWIVLAICLALTMASLFRARTRLDRDSGKRLAGQAPPNRRDDGSLIERHS